MEKYFVSCDTFGGSKEVCCDARYEEALRSMCNHPQAEGSKCVTSNSSYTSPESAYCIHHEDSAGKKCYEACSTGAKFNSTGLTTVGKCPVHYDTLDSTKNVTQCPDGVTNVKYCKGHTVEVTMRTRGKAGHCLHNEDAIDHKCYEACAYSKFKMKGFTTTGYCPDKYNAEEKATTHRQCPDGVTNLKYCEATAVMVTVRTIGEHTGAAALSVTTPESATCTKDGDCPCSYCMNDASKKAPYYCHANLPGKCCTTDKDCPGSYCVNYAGKTKPYFCHGS
jgi:hypothetical protein